jgi:UDP-N-acetylglucosamine--N-acetylmuramyl-(pentapeptide) pyrophosphoryl-undecaprenol N-acetylglucosamine transferase
VSVAEKILRVGAQAGAQIDFYYVGVPGAYEQVLASRTITVSRIASAKMRQSDLLRNIIDVPFFFVSFVQAFWKVFFIMPDVLFSKGGPGALPVVLACAFYRIPIIIHESDSVAGLTNRISGHYADRIAIAFATARESFIGGIANQSKRDAMEKKIALVGNPIRDFFFAAPDVANRADAKKMLDFDPQKKLILIIGGSQGSVRINDFFMGIAEELLNKNIQVFHQTGVENFSAVSAELEPLMKKYSTTFRNAYRIVPYFDEHIKDAYLATDVVVSRAGSGSLFEIAAMGRASILVPLPESARDHQAKNAFEYATTGAAITIEEINLTKNIFFTQLDKLFLDDRTIASMEAAARAFARPEAAEMLAKEIIRLGTR